MKFLKIALAATALTAMAVSANAQDSNAYINVGVDAFEFDSYTVSGKVGYDFNDYFGLEAQGGLGISDSDDSFDQVIDGFTVSGTSTAGIDNFVAGFAKVKFPVSERVDVFARGGYHFTQIGFDTDDFTVTSPGLTRTIQGTEANLDTDGFAIGAGAQFMLDALNGIRIEYSYFDVEDIDGIDFDNFDDVDFGEVGSDIYSVSYVRKF